jgi:hypothetical protein
MGDDAVGVADAASPAAGVAAIRCRQRTISSVVYDEQYVIPISQRVFACRWKTDFNNPITSILATAPASTAGQFFVINPVGSAVILAIARLTIISYPTAATAFVSAPRICYERITFTGTLSGPSFQVKMDSTDAAPVGKWATNSVGLTVTVLTGIGPVGIVSPVLTAVGWSAINWQDSTDYQTREDDHIILRAGEGIQLRQLDNGTASDTRRWVGSAMVEEFTLP